MALPLLLGLLASSGNVPAAEAAREGITVEAGDTTFSVDRFDDGRSKPYRVTFTEEDGVKSIHRFSETGFVTNIVVGGSEKYKVLYDSNGDLSEVRLTASSSGRRDLLAAVEGQEIDREGGAGGAGREGGGEATVAEGAGMLVGGGGQGGLVNTNSNNNNSNSNSQQRRRRRRRRLYACDDCVEAWDAVCDEGVPSVCDLVGYGDPLSAEAEASIATVCDGMGEACSNSGGEEACMGQCEEDDDGTDDKG